MSEKLYKDIIMICKGWYSEDYDNAFEALNAYYHRNNKDIHESSLTHDGVIDFYLIPTMEWVFKNGYGSYRVYFDKTTDRLCRICNAYNSYIMGLCNGMIVFLHSLDIKGIDENTGKSYWIIDMSEYKEDVI